MPTRRYVFRESVANPSALRSRYRTLGGDKALLLPVRPGLAVGDEVLIMLWLEAPGRQMRVSGVVRAIRSSVVVERRVVPSALLALDSASIATLEPFLLDARRHPQPPRRLARRKGVARWTECRLSSQPVRRSCRIVDASPGGLFLASGLEVSDEQTVFFQTNPGRPWLGGTVRWRGAKLGHTGFGLQLVFSRAVERHTWHDWYVHEDASAL